MEKLSAFRWSDAMKDDLVRLGRQKLSFSEIAKKLNEIHGTNFTRNSCIGIARRENLVARRSCVEVPQKRAKPVLRLVKMVVPKVTPEQKARLEKTVEPEACGPLDDFPPSGTCLFIHGDPAIRGWRCCGVPKQPMSPYCRHHTIACTTVHSPSRNSSKVLQRQVVRR